MNCQNNDSKAFFVITVVFLADFGFDLRASAPAREAIYYLSHASIPFCSG
jgi:hypothetical protein